VTSTLARVPISDLQPSGGVGPPWDEPSKEAGCRFHSELIARRRFGARSHTQHLSEKSYVGATMFA
jgi:hypothetical protein